MLNAGWSSHEGKQAITLFDDVSLNRINVDKLDYVPVSPVLNPLTTTAISDKSDIITNLCKPKRDLDVQISYKLIEPQVHKGTALNLVAYYSRVY